MIRKRLVPVKLSKDELSLVNTAILLSPFKNRREFYELISRSFSESARKTMGRIARCNSNRISQTISEHLTSVEVKKLLEFVKEGTFHKNNSVTTSVLLKVDEKTWEFMKRNFTLGPLVKSCIIHAAKKVIEKSQKDSNVN